MAAGTVTAEGDWAGAPATKGDLILLRSNLEGKVNNVRVEMAEMGRALSKEIGDVKGQVGDLRGQVGDLRGQVGDLRGQVGDLRGQVGGLRGEVGGLRDELRTEVSKLRVSMAWMTLGVTTLLGSLIAIFQFLS